MSDDLNPAARLSHERWLAQQRHAQGPYFAEGSPAMVALEAMVDRVGIRNVLYALGEICFDKAEHLLVNWQDERGNKQWTDCGNAIDKLVNTVPRTPLD